MSKKAGAATQSIVRMLVPAGKAAPAPPVGPALGQKGSWAGKGSAQPRIVEAGQISLKHIYEIAKIKQGDRAFEGVSLEAVCRSIIGTSQEWVLL
ncbi:hypothetical protein BSLG_001040 [Batrachochytrium salamandrivorans]|nr:hypothetical protein BSLG_001040 [Batrachochytrium salamandrivorans]